MADLRLENYLLASIFFIVVIIAGMGLITDVNTSYNVSMGQETAFNTTYSRAQTMYNDTYDTSLTMKGKVIDADITEDTTENSMFKGAFSALRSLTGLFSLVGGLVNDVGAVLGIPSIFINMGIIAFLTILSMAIIYLVFRFKP